MKIDLDNPLSSSMLGEILKLDSDGKYIFIEKVKTWNLKKILTTLDGVVI